jgi:DNA-binding beta-propeller fold protein YncE
MTNSRSILYILTLGGICFFSSCDSGSEEPLRKTGVLIVNEGNFGAGNGSVSSYDEEKMTITNNFVKAANNGSEIGSLVQSVMVHEGVGYIVCNNADKIEFIDAGNGKYLANPLTNISQPRYMTVVGNKGYVTCWGPWDKTDPFWWKLNDSYISVVDLVTKEVVDSLACGSGPEGIIAVGNQLLVANSFESSVSVIDLSDESSNKVTVDIAPQQLVEDARGVVWVSSSNGLHSINPANLNVADNIAVTNIQGKIAFNGDHSIYLLTVESWEPNTVNFESNVLVFDTDSKEVSSEALITGSDFYGLGYNETTQRIYVSDSKAFSGPGEISVYDIDGTLLDLQVTAVGPNGVAFK